MATSLDKLGNSVSEATLHKLREVRITTVEALKGRLADAPSAMSMRKYLGLSELQLSALLEAIDAVVPEPVVSRRPMVKGTLIPSEPKRAIKN